MALSDEDRSSLRRQATLLARHSGRAPRAQLSATGREMFIDSWDDSPMLQPSLISARTRWAVAGSQDDDDVVDRMVRFALQSHACPSAPAVLATARSIVTQKRMTDRVDADCAQWVLA